MAIKRLQRIVFSMLRLHALIQSLCVQSFSFCLLGKQSVLGSFDLSSGNKRKIADVTVLKAKPRAVGKVPPVPVNLGLSFLVVFTTAIR